MSPSSSKTETAQSSPSINHAVVSGSFLPGSPCHHHVTRLSSSHNSQLALPFPLTPTALPPTNKLPNSRSSARDRTHGAWPCPFLGLGPHLSGGGIEWPWLLFALLFVPFAFSYCSMSSPPFRIRPAPASASASASLPRRQFRHLPTCAALAKKIRKRGSIGDGQHGPWTHGFPITTVGLKTERSDRKIESHGPGFNKGPPKYPSGGHPIPAQVMGVRPNYPGLLVDLLNRQNGSARASRPSQ